MLELSILKIDDPSCMWGRIMRGPGVQVASQEAYDYLKVEMNLFYHDVNLDPQSVKPSSIKKGQLCALFSPLLSSWCRAIVESVYQGDGGSRVTCCLADHVEEVNVTADRVYVLMERFLHLPFRVRKFHLADIYPLSLRVSIIDAKAELVPSFYWDSSATRYLYILWQASSQVEAVVCGSQDDRLEIELYLTINHVKICANHDLLAKRFACTKTEKESLQKEGRGLPPVFLKGDMFSNPEKFLAVNGFGVTPTSLNGVTHNISTFPTSDVDQRLAIMTTHIKTANDDIFRGAQEAVSEEAREEPVSHEPATLRPVQILDRPCDGVEPAGNTYIHLLPPPDLVIEEEISASESSDEPGPTLADEVMAELKLFRYLKFINPDAVGEFKSKVDPNCVSDSGHSLTHSSDEVPEVEEVEVEVVEERAVPEMPRLQEDHELVSPEPVQTDIAPCYASDTDGPSVKDWNKEEENRTQQPRTEEEHDAARLLEYLNPGPLSLNVEDDVLVVPVIPKRDGVLLHSSVGVEPWQSVAHSPLSKSFKRYLKGREGSATEVGLRYCWPHVFRGNDTLLVTHAAQDPLTYLPPLVTYMQNTSDHSSLTARFGLVAVILCPGWEKVHTVLDLLETSHTAQDLKPTMVLLGQSKEEAQAFRLQTNCRLLVTTPFTLVRLLKAHCSLFLHLSHLVMDEVDKLYTCAPKEMEEVLKHFRNVVASSPGSQTPQQLVAVGSSWNVCMEGLVTDYMRDATVIITVAQEAALYGGVHQMIHLCLDCEKVPVMLRALDFSPAFPQKTLVITSSIEELEQVYEAVASSPALALRVHEGVTHQFELVMEHWSKATGAGTHIVLVTTEKCLKALGIDDATCVVHYGFPMTPKLFGSRLFCMSNNFRVLSDKYHPEDEKRGPRVANSILLLTDKNSRQVSGVLRYLRRTDALLPPELLRFAEGIQQVKEQQKAHRPLCGYLKSLGFCKDTRECPDRHILDRAQDDHRHLKTELVEVVPLYIKSASVYYGHLVSRGDTRFEELAAKMAAHYAAEHRWATAAVEGELYAIQLDDEYQRVRVVSVPEKGNCLFSCATVHFIDEGSTRTVKSHQLLQLPPEFQGLPPQAVEIILCGAKPIDNEVDWDPKATRAISQTIRGKRHQAKVVMCLGNTVWVSSMVRRTPAPLLKTFINVYDVCSEVLATGLGLAHSEKEHLSWLQKALKGPLGIIDHSLLLQSENLSGDALALDKPAACGIQDESQEVAGESLAPSLQIPVEPPKTELHVAEPLSLKAMQAECISGSLGTATPSGQIDIRLLKHEELNGFSPQSWSSSVSAPCVIDEPVASPKLTMKKILEVYSPSSHQPQVKWFQRQDVVVLRVKLPNPVMQTCHFFNDRVVYSAYVNGMHYYAALDLQNTISADLCSWSMKCNEPEIRLVKKEQGEWTALLKHKNALVSYDFDHIEDEEINLDEHRFVGFIAEEGCSYVTSKSESDSDSD